MKLLPSAYFDLKDRTINRMPIAYRLLLVAALIALFIYTWH